MELRFDRKSNIHLPFPTPTATFLLPNAAELNRRLEPLILEKEAGDPGMNYSNVGGLLLVFPSWLQHYVNPFVSDTLRISLAFNARINSFEAL
jgi:hypothetical protein